MMIDFYSTRGDYSRLYLYYHTYLSLLLLDMCSNMRNMLCQKVTEIFEGLDFRLCNNLTLRCQFSYISLMRLLPNIHLRRYMSLQLKLIPLHVLVNRRNSLFGWCQSRVARKCESAKNTQ